MPSNTAGTPVGEGNHHHNHPQAGLESHIPSRPFAFQSVPQGRGGNIINKPSGQQQQQQQLPTKSNAASAMNTSTSSSSEQPQTMRGAERNSNSSSGASQPPTGSDINVSANLATAPQPPVSTPTVNTGGTKGRQGGGASDFVKKLYKCVGTTFFYDSSTEHQEGKRADCILMLVLYWP